MPSGNQPLEIETPEGTLRFGRAGHTNKSPLTPQDRMLIMSLVKTNTENMVICDEVNKRRIGEGLSVLDTKPIKVGITWARRSINRDMVSQKQTTKETKRSRILYNSLLEDYLFYKEFVKKSMAENPLIIQDPSFQKVCAAKHTLAEQLVRINHQPKRHIPRLLSDKAIEVEKSYKDQLPEGIDAGN